MLTILIIGGAGRTGRSLARHLLGQTAARLVLAGRRLDRVEAAAAECNAEFPGDRVSARRADAAAPDDLRAVLEGVQLLIVAAPVGDRIEAVARAALEAGADMLDIQLGDRKFAALTRLAPEIELAGRCFITEAGFHPGLPAAMIRHAGARFEQLEYAMAACYLNMGRNLAWSEAWDELMEVFARYNGRILKRGSWTRPDSFSALEFDFGGEIGTRRCYSMFFEELRPLPDLYPSLQNVGFFVAGSHWLVDSIITPVVLMILRTAPRLGIRPMGRVMSWAMGKFARPPWLVLLKLQAGGRRAGRPEGFSLSVSHADGYELTAIPVVACLLQVLDGSARRPGLSMMGHLVDPGRLLDDMRRMGVAVTASPAD